MREWWRSTTRADRVVLAAALLAALALKAHYSAATAGELRWILGPTTALVAAALGTPFAFEGGSGYLSTEAGLLIAPVCAGVNFLIVALSAGAVGLVPLVREPGRKALFAVGWVGVAYGATVLANAVRILVVQGLRDLRLPGLGPDQLHRLEGVGVYLAALCGLYLLSHGLLTRRLRGHPA